MQMLWCGLGGVSMTTVTIAAQWPGRHLNTHNGGKLHLRLITHTPRTGDPPLHNLHTCWAKACLHHTNYAYATHRHAFSTQFTCMLSTGVPLSQKIKMTDAFLFETNYTQRSSITQITHNKQAFLPYTNYSHRQSSSHKFYKCHTLVFLNETNYTHRRSSLTQIIHIGVPPWHMLLQHTI